jgi:hypothetical protein
MGGKLGPKIAALITIRLCHELTYVSSHPMLALPPAEAPHVHAGLQATSRVNQTASVVGRSGSLGSGPYLCAADAGKPVQSSVRKGEAGRPSLL